MKRASTILLVEDNEDDIFFMQRAFEDALLKNPLHVVMDGQQAIDYIEGQHAFADRALHPLPDFVFLDLKLPVLDGFEVLAWLREKQSTLPVAVLSSSPEESDMRRARQLGASCYLLKPPTVSMLRSCWSQFGLT